MEFEPELAQLDQLLDDDELFKLLKADLLKRYPNSGRLGRHSTPAEGDLANNLATPRLSRDRQNGFPS
jgi:hypothetical protein